MLLNANDRLHVIQVILAADSFPGLVLGFAREQRGSSCIKRLIWCKTDAQARQSCTDQTCDTSCITCTAGFKRNLAAANI